jgi:serine/threonine protein kinase
MKRKIYRTVKRKSKRFNKTIKRGGMAKIGTGRTSTVFSPPLHCENGSHGKFSSHRYVSKLVREETADTEMKLAEKLKEIDPESNYTIFPLHRCSIAHDGQTNTNFRSGMNDLHRKVLLFSVNGGRTLTELYDEIESSKQSLGKSFIPKLNKSLHKLGEFILLMNHRGIYHSDISLDNLVYDPDTYHIRLIDFELSTINSPTSTNDKFDFIGCCFNLNELFERKYGDEYKRNFIFTGYTYMRDRKKYTNHINDNYRHDLQVLLDPIRSASSKSKV